MQQQQQQQMTTVVQTQPTVVMAPTPMGGGCASCGVGVMREKYTCCGVLLGIIFFPIGIICCCMMKERKCIRCGYTI
ncbi:hypothetical protein DPMN_027553 [Dreissena polymorpha]|uniref:Membrane protein BRI3 n=1 Tax=Dreissena polymorpha TaxID=45954 RepID=A0A9D4LTQ1_DREPO|nr:hypothetical protein DPMN_027553 [Dreissena polymorpha]